MSNAIPLIKEYRITNLRNSLRCFETNKFDRIAQRKCVLKNYDHSSNDISHLDKSIFRGMVIPSLRSLGLIYGDGDSIKVSSNGKIIIDSEGSEELHSRVLRSVLYEIDQRIFNFIPLLIKLRFPSKELFTKSFASRNASDVTSPLKERINKWLSLLEESKLIKAKEGIISINDDAFRMVEFDKEPQISVNAFLKVFLNEYKVLSKNNIGIVKIEDLRGCVCTSFLQEGLILTDLKFDNLLASVPLETKSYIFSLGKPMGAQDRLFAYRDKFYDTLHIKFI